MDLKKGMDELEEKIKRFTGKGIDWGYHYDLLSEMHRRTVGMNSDASRIMSIQTRNGNQYLKLIWE